MTTIGKVIPNVYEFEWKIPDFLSYSKEDGVCYKSPYFYFNTESFYLLIKPNGAESNSSFGYISVYLFRERCNPPLRLQYSLSLKTVNGKKDIETNYTTEFAQTVGGYGSHRYLPRSELLKRESMLLPSGILTVVCSIKNPDSSGNWHKHRVKILVAVLIGIVAACVYIYFNTTYFKTSLPPSDIHLEGGEKIQSGDQNKVDQTEVGGDNNFKFSSSNENMESESPPPQISSQKYSGCPEEFGKWRDLGGEYCYYFEEAKRHSFHEALSDCEVKGGSLASLHSKEENDMLLQLAKNTRESIFIGLYKRSWKGRIFKNEEFAWTDGSVFDYENWHVNEPDRMDEKCVVIVARADSKEIAFRWDDVRCESKRAYICSAKKKPSLQPQLIVTGIHSTYLEIFWVLPEELKRNTKSYIVYFRKPGDKWQEIFINDVSQTSCNLTSLDPGVLYQTYIMSVGSSGISKFSESATVRTLNVPIYDDSPKSHVKQSIFLTIVITVIVIVTGYVYVYSKRLLPHISKGETATVECPYCKMTFKSTRITSHSISCIDKSMKCPKCCEVVTEQWLDHKCVTSRAEAIDKLLCDFERIMKNGDHSDTTIKVKMEEFQLHRSILGARNSFFHSKFKNESREMTPDILSIDECEPDHFRILIKYIYTGRVDNLCPENVCDLYDVAVVYQEEKMKAICLQFMIDTMSVTNFCSYTSFGLKRGEKELYQKASELFTREAKQIIRHVEWKTFLEKCPMEANELYMKVLN